MESYYSKKNGYEPLIDEYNQIATKYDNQWAFYIKSTTQQTLRHLELNGDEDILDIGCGTGTLLKAISSVYPEAKLTGVDLSVKMLKVAQQKLTTNADFLICCSEHLPFSDGSFDVAISCNSFHYFRFPWQALKEISRVLRPEGRFIMTDWCRDYILCRLLDVSLKLFNKFHYNIYGSKDCLQMLQLNDYHFIVIERYKINWFWGLITAKAQKGV